MSDGKGTGGGAIVINKMTWEEAVEWLISDPAQVNLVASAYFDDPILQSSQRFAASDEWRATAQWLPERAGTALDLGAGRGIASFALARAGWTVTALEPDPSQLVGAGAIRQLFKDACLPVKVVEEFGEKLAFEPCSFDVVYCRQVLHHARDLTELCLEAFRVLKPGGVFIATREHVVNNHGASLDAFLARHPLHHLYGGEAAYTLSEYQDALVNAGFRMLRSYGPFATAVNYSEDSVELHADRYRLIVARVVGHWAATRLWEQLMIRRVLVKCADAILNAFWRGHGRLYSFVARRI